MKSFVSYQDKYHISRAEKLASHGVSWYQLLLIRLHISYQDRVKPSNITSNQNRFGLKHIDKRLKQLSTIDLNFSLCRKWIEHGDAIVRRYFLFVREMNKRFYMWISNMAYWFFFISLLLKINYSDSHNNTRKEKKELKPSVAMDTIK